MDFKRLLGTEPALITGAVQAVLAVFITTATLSPEASGVIMVVVSAVTGAVATWTTIDSRLTAVVEVVKAVLLAVTFFQIGGLNFSEETQVAIVTAVTALGTVFVRANTVPAPTSVSVPTAATAEVLAPGHTEVLEDGEFWEGPDPYSDTEDQA